MSNYFRVLFRTYRDKSNSYYLIKIPKDLKIKSSCRDRWRASRSTGPSACPVITRLNPPWTVLSRLLYNTRLTRHHVDRRRTCRRDNSPRPLGRRRRRRRITYHDEFIIVERILRDAIVCTPPCVVLDTRIHHKSRCLRDRARPTHPSSVPHRTIACGVTCGERHCAQHHPVVGITYTRCVRTTGHRSLDSVTTRVGGTDIFVLISTSRQIDNLLAPLRPRVLLWYTLTEFLRRNHRVL